MESEGVLSVSMASVVESVLQKHGTRLNDLNLASRKAEEAALRRNEATGWLRTTVGFVCSKDLPAEPSEQEFRIALRNGIILCNALNKVRPGAVPKVVETSSDSVVLPDGAALSAYQYFENIRNFLVATQEMGIPSFEASDLEQGGKGSRVVNCILALKSYNDWKHRGGNGIWKYGGNLKPINSLKCIKRKNSEPFMNPLSRNPSMGEKSWDSLLSEQNGDLSLESSEMNACSLHVLVRSVLADKKPEEIPMLVESMLSKVMEEFEHRLASQNDLVKTTLEATNEAASDGNKSFTEGSNEMKVKTTFQTTNDAASDGNSYLTEGSSEMKMEMEDENAVESRNEEPLSLNSACDEEHKGQFLNQQEEHKGQLLKQQVFFIQKQKDIQELRDTLHSTRADMRFMQMKYSKEFCNLGRHFHSLTQAACMYHKVLEENRKLYNEVQDLKGSIRVYCRVRPFLSGQPNRQSTVDRIDEGSITIITPSKYGKEGRRSFNFNKVFGPFATQEEVFTDTEPLIRSVLDGYNVCIFAYGQTGSGKTYTMSGPNELTEHSQGVNYRALSDLFQLSEERRETSCYDVSVQMLEIYNEQVRDLLASDGLNKRLEIRNSSQNGLNVPEASLVHVASTSDVIELMNIGQRNRAVSATAMNDRSSRSHSCLTAHVQGRDITSGAIIRGSMHLVDLAGSERVDKSEVIGDRLKEAQHINKSLAALGDVISALAQKNSHVPYRNSKLTQLLQDSLGGQAKTLMFVHMSPELDAVGETISTLKFAERVATVELGTARMHKESGDVKELKEQIAVLKAALAKKEGEPEHLTSSISSPDLSRMRGSGLSPSHSRKGGADISSDNNNRHPMGDVGNIEVQNNSALRQRKPNFDVQELSTSNNSPSPSWDSNSASSPSQIPKVDFQKGDKEEEDLEEDWVDKMILNKNEVASGDPSRRWEGNNGSLPESFYQNYLPDMRVHPEKPYGKQGNKKEARGYESATTDDSDELEVATTASENSSEADMLWSGIPSNGTAAANGFRPKSKKPKPKMGKIPELRSPSSSNSLKGPNGGSHSFGRNGRPPSNDGKRSASFGRKTGSGK